MEAGGQLDDAGLGGEHHREPDASGRGTGERKSSISKGHGRVSPVNKEFKGRWKKVIWV